MIAIIYLTGTKRVIGIITEVREVLNTDIIGAESANRGIDMTKASFVVVASSDVAVGDTIDPTKLTDVRDLLPETPAQKIARLEAEKAALDAQVTQLNADFAGFIDFYFTQNPDQA